MLSACLKNIKNQEPASKEQGFTLIELLVVILIIGILSAIAVPAFLNQRKSAQDAAMLSDIHQIKLAYQQYKTSNPNSTHYPDLVVNWINQDTDTPANMDPNNMGAKLKLTPGARFHVFDGNAYAHGYAPSTTIIIEAGREGSNYPGMVGPTRYIEVYKP